MAESFEPRVLLSTYVVTNLNDSGPGSLRDAIQQANVDPGPDAIDFAAGLSGTITLTSGGIHISDSTGQTAIIGPGANILTVSGGGVSSIFQVDATSSAEITAIGVTDGSSPPNVPGGSIENAGMLTLNQVSVTNSKSSGIYNSGNAEISDSTISQSAYAGILSYLGAGSFPTLSLSASELYNNSGGGIMNLGSLNVSGSTISSNKAPANGNGGGIYTGGGSVSITQSSFTGNSSSLDGGGIYIQGGSVSLAGDTFSDNSASDLGGAIRMFNGSELSVATSTFSGNRAAAGGAIQVSNYVNQGVTLSDSSFDSNIAAGNGGAIEAETSLDIIRSTFSQNMAVNGGGVYGGLPLRVASSTFFGNQAVGGSGGALYNTILRGSELSACTIYGNIAASGGGIFVPPAGSLPVSDSIIAGNKTSDSDQPNDVVGPAYGSYNILGTGGSGFTYGTTGNVLGVSDPMLAPLGRYGGGTRTMPPLPGSPAIDAGSFSQPTYPDGTAITTDQRGLPRVSGGRMDIGAAEFQWNPGDVNKEGAVNFADLLVLAQHYGKHQVTWRDGDLDGNGIIGFSDLLIVAQNYGGSSLDPAAGASPLDDFLRIRRTALGGRPRRF